jgi:hypothetical protein
VKVVQLIISHKPFKQNSVSLSKAKFMFYTFSHSVSDKFTSSGELIQTENDKNTTEVGEVGPEKRTDLLSFEFLFTLSPKFISEFVKNKSEANLLLEISHLGAQLDILVKYYIAECQQGEVTFCYYLNIHHKFEVQLTQETVVSDP